MLIFFLRESKKRIFFILKFIYLRGVIKINFSSLLAESQLSKTLSPDDMIYVISGCETLEKLHEYIFKNTMTCYHYVGTCSMGDGDAYPVDTQLRLKGIENIRVADVFGDTRGDSFSDECANHDASLPCCRLNYEN